jgi:hypothetical protein
MVALGSEGLLSAVEDGVHLRWQMDLALGFPPYGFDLFRRAHRIPSRSPLVAQARPDGVVPLGKPCRAIRLRLRLSGVGGEAVGRFAGAPMTSAPLGGGAGTEVVLEMQADALDEVQLPAGTVVVQAQGTRVSHEALVGWGSALNGAHRIGLPLTDPAYPVTHAHAPNDWAEAGARLSRRTTPSGPLALPADLASRYGGQHFQDLQAVLRHIGANATSPFPGQATGAGSPQMQLSPTALVSLLALDPNLARMLGLLWVDRSATAGVRYDYKVIGYWSAGSASSQTTCADLSTFTLGASLEPGTTLTLSPATATPPGPSPMGRDSTAPSTEEGAPGPSTITLSALPSNRVVEVSSPWGLARGLNLVGLPSSRLQLDLDRAAAGVILYLSRPDQALQVHARDATGSPLEVSVQQREVGGRFVEVEVNTPGTTTLEIDKGSPFTLFRVCTVTQVITGNTREWICFDVTRTTPAALEPPQGVTVSAVPAVDPDDSPLLNPAAIKGRHGLAAALSWASPASSTAMLSRGTLAYHVFRRSLGNGATAAALPAAPPPSGYQRLTEDSTGADTMPVPVKPARTSVPRSRPAGWPSVPVHFVDGEARDRWYAYAVQGIDVFGRTSAPTVVTAELKDLLAPPPPTGTSAALLDGALTADDPEYVPGLHALIPLGADSLLLIQWDWPPARYRSAPDVAEFRLYWQPSRLNTLSGVVTSVANKGDTSDVTVALDAGTLAKSMTDGWLRLGNDFFRVVASTTGTSPTITVRNLRLTRAADGAPTPPGKGRCTLAIGGGDGAGIAADPNFVDYLKPVGWATRLGAVPLVQPAVGLITSVASHSLSGTLPAAAWQDNGDGTSSVPLNRALRQADGLLRGGSFLIGGHQCAILGNSDGPAAVALLQNPGVGTPPAAPSPPPAGSYTLTAPGLREVLTDIPAATPATATASLALVGGTLVTASGEFRVIGVYPSGTPAQLAFAVQAEGALPAPGACAWFPGYQVTAVPNPPLSVGQRATVAGAVGVSAADERSYVADARGDSLRTGNEGAVSPPMIVTRQRRGPVAPPSAPFSALPVGQAHLYATAPDYHGRSFYTLSWPATPGLTHLVYRALDQALFLRDRQQRRALTGYYAGRPPFDDDPGFQTWFSSYSAAVPGLTLAQLTAPESGLSSAQKTAVSEAWEAWAARFYPALTDGAVQALADRAGNEAAFVRLNAEPVSTASYQDTLDGRAPSRFLYRLRAVDVAGNQSPLGGSSLPVYVPAVVAPTAPTLLEAEAGPEKITIRWVENTETKLDHYRLYRANSPKDAEDLRTMTLHHRIAKSPSATLRPGEVAPTAVSGVAGRLEFAELVKPNSPYWYRLVVVDSEGNRSQPSIVMQGMAFGSPPAPVTVDKAEWTPTAAGLAIRVQWTAKQGVDVRPQRRAAGSSAWVSSPDWVSGASGAADLLTTESYVSHEVRLETRAASGNFTVAGPAITLPPEGT